MSRSNLLAAGMGVVAWEDRAEGVETLAGMRFAFAPGLTLDCKAMAIPDHSRDLRLLLCCAPKEDDLDRDLIEFLRYYQNIVKWVEHELSMCRGGRGGASRAEHMILTANKLLCTNLHRHL